MITDTLSACPLEKKGPYPDSIPGSGKPPLPSNQIYNCLANSIYDQRTPEYQIDPYFTGWQTFSHQTVDVTADMSAKIKQIYNIDFDADVHYDISYKSQSWIYKRWYWINHWQCTSSGRNFKFINKQKYTNTGEGMEYSPTYFWIIMAWPQDHKPVWDTIWSPNPPQP